jgi:hypothetical protein
MLADNRLGELASWDDGRLRLELEELKSLDLDFALEATGFELSEIDLRIGVAVGPAVDDRGRDQRSRPERRAPVARAGDTWALGPHRLVCADDAAGFSALDAAIRRWQAVTGESAPSSDRRAFRRGRAGQARSLLPQAGEGGRRQPAG